MQLNSEMSISPNVEKPECDRKSTVPFDYYWLYPCYVSKNIVAKQLHEQQWRLLSRDCCRLSWAEHWRLLLPSPSSSGLGQGWSLSFVCRAHVICFQCAGATHKTHTLYNHVHRQNSVQERTNMPRICPFADC